MNKSKRRFNLTLKLNLLIIAIILSVSAGLTFITYHLYCSKINSLYFSQIEKMAGIVTTNYSENLIMPLINMAQSEEFRETRDEARRKNDPEILETWMAEHIISDFYSSSIQFGYDELESEGKMPLDELFSGIYEYLKYQQKVFGVSSIYIQYDLDHITYNLVDTSKTVLDIGTSEKSYEEFDEYDDNESIPATLILQDDTWICTACGSLYDFEDETIAVAGVDMNMDDVMKERRWFLWNCIIFVVILTILAIAAAMFLFYRTVGYPLEKLAKAAMSFCSEDSGYVETNIISEDIYANDEIGDLYGEIRSMETRIVDYAGHLEEITAEKERTLTELRTAARIQESMLPSIFPAFPDRKEFDLYASMTPAKEVGGDFYDFFFRDDNHLVLLIADVSGKGIPAALFMMASKILIHEKAMAGGSPSQILMEVNNRICEDNPYEMFVTVWLGILEISSGKMVCSNAGHEYPVIRQPEGKFELLRDKHGFVLGGMENVKYKDYELNLQKGSSIFVYTDGVAEATDAKEELYGTDRLLEAMNQIPEGSPAQILEQVRSSVDAFVRDEQQFDDLTMLCLRFNGEE